jgi:hypothetical protein
VSTADVIEQLEVGGIHVRPAGGMLALSPSSRVTGALRAAVAAHRSELLKLLHRRPWPPSRGRDGFLGDPETISKAIGRRARLRGETRPGRLWGTCYDTRTGEKRCVLLYADGSMTEAWPEEVEVEA